jgi:hypothetical protein
MAAERGVFVSADVEVKGLSADGFQQSYSRGRVLNTFQDNDIPVERCTVEHYDVGGPVPNACSRQNCTSLPLQTARAHGQHAATSRQRMYTLKLPRKDYSVGIRQLCVLLVARSLRTPVARSCARCSQSAPGGCGQRSLTTTSCRALMLTRCEQPVLLDHLAMCCTAGRRCAAAPGVQGGG